MKQNFSLIVKEILLPILLTFLTGIAGYIGNEIHVMAAQLIEIKVDLAKCSQILIEHERRLNSLEDRKGKR